MFNLFSKLFSRKSEGMAESASGKAPHIFIAYRRSDSLALTGRIFDRLALKFGSGSIFMDVDAIPFGADFGKVVVEELLQCDVIFAIMGPDWLGQRDNQGSRRIDDPHDYVRMELEAALQLQKPIIPILVGGALMPSANELPYSLKEISQRNAVEVDAGPNFHRHMDGLIRAVEGLLDRSAHDVQVPTRLTPDIDISDLNVNQVFVSHATTDREWVEKQVVAPLNESGVKTWYSRKSITSSTQWEREILKGLESCDWFLLVVSPASSQSEWVKDELNWAVAHRPNKIVPVIHEFCDLWSFHIRLPRLQYIDFTHAPGAQHELLSAFVDSAPVQGRVRRKQVFKNLT